MKIAAFVTEDMPSNVKGWLDDYERQILHYRSLGQGRLQSVRDEGSRAWVDLLEGSYDDPPQNTAVSPLLSTTWNQTQYYNNLCPYNSYLGERTVTGCVATAMAQVMKYWNHPATGHGSHSYAHSYYGTLSANFGTTTYAWTSMPAQLTSSSTTAQRTAVATLMYHVGVAMEMNYDVAANGGSGALAYSNGDPFEPSAENALRTYFKYKSSLRQVSIDDYSNADWSALLMSELNASRPILYSGRDSTGGHCFVCDGYDNGGQFHINWGWGGWCDGYYAIGSLNPSSGGTGGNASSTFNLKNVAVIGIEPNSSFGSTTTVTATSNNTSYGTVTGGGTFTGTNTDTVALYATAAPGCRFTGWNDEHQFTPRAFLANGGNWYEYPAEEIPFAETSKTAPIPGISNSAGSLRLGSSVSQLLYAYHTKKAKMSDYTFLLNGKEVENVRDLGNAYVVQISEIAITKLTNESTLTVIYHEGQADQRTYSLTVSPTAYLYETYQADPTSNLGRLAYYLYNYYVATTLTDIR